MPAWTVRFTAIPDDAECGAIVDAFARRGAHIRFERAQFGRQYALVEADDDRALAALADRAAVFPGPVIALAVSPTVSEALPLLADALGGAGRPSGIVGCETAGGAVLVEWDLDRTDLETIDALIDTELTRYRSGRINALLSPLPDAWLARLAAAALRAPDIQESRILEVQLQRAGFDV